MPIMHCRDAGQGDLVCADRPELCFETDVIVVVAKQRVVDLAACEYVMDAGVRRAKLSSHRTTIAAAPSIRKMAFLNSGV